MRPRWVVVRSVSSSYAPAVGGGGVGELKRHAPAEGGDAADELKAMRPGDRRPFPQWHGGHGGFGDAGAGTEQTRESENPWPHGRSYTGGHEESDSGSGPS